MDVSQTHYFSAAEDAVSRKDFARAVDLYREAIHARPELQNIYKFNLERALQGLRSVEPSKTGGRSPNYESVTIHDLYREVDRAFSDRRIPREGSGPLASVIMTTHNVEEYIEESITSLVRQSYQPLELIVIDDSSTDQTWTILTRLKTQYRMKIRRLNSNLGTYFAKNFGIKIARGEFIFFQDGDDLSHPDRILLCMRELNSPGVVCVQSSYSRILFPEGRVLPVNGLVKKLGLITLGVRRSVFDEIGYFNCTTKASDDEFFQRLKAYYKQPASALRILDLPLYFGTFRRDSLFADMVANDVDTEGVITQRTSPDRQEYVATFQKMHKLDHPSSFKNKFRFPVLRDPLPVSHQLTKLANPEIPVIASVCSIPERKTIFRRMLASLAPQVDEIHIYLDRYEDIPEFVRQCHPKAVIRTSSDFPGLRDNGKFVPLLDNRSPCYFFTADDDIEYPPDYVNTLIKKLRCYDHLTVIGVHGVIIPERPRGYFTGFRRVYNFSKELERDQLVNILGTGTVAFHSATLKGLDYRTFTYSGMADLYLAVLCKSMGVPMISISRPENWLRPLEDTATSTSCLFKEGLEIDDRRFQLLRMHVPWGYNAISKSLDRAMARAPRSEASRQLSALLPILRHCTI